MADDDTGATPSGLLQCLSMLVDEARSMQLARTSVAIQAALEVCRAEADTGVGQSIRRSLGTVLH